MNILEMAIAAKMAGKNPGGGGGVTDYNKLENRPFGSNGMKTVEILPETTVEIEPESGGSMITYTSVTAVKTGQAYTVNWNGTDYNCTAQGFVMEGVTIGNALGNIGAMSGGADTGEPFIVAFVYPEFVEATGGSIAVFALDGSASVTLSITAEIEDNDKMEGKFLPKGTPYIEPFDDVLLEETVLADAVVLETAGSILYNLPIGNIKPGKIYNIVIDGCTYQAKAYPMEGDDAELGVAVLGTGYYGGGTQIIPYLPYSNLPFQITVLSSAGAAAYGATVQINWTTEEEPEKIAIKGGFTVNKMDELCLPDFPVPMVVTFTPVSESSKNYVADAEYLAALSAVNMGRPLFAKVWRKEGQNLNSGFNLCMCRSVGSVGISFGYFENGAEVHIQWNNFEIKKTRTYYTEAST